jgi:excisionase family DNA binding protein
MSTPVHSRRYLSVKEAAEQLSVSERTVRRLVDAGRVPAVRVGGPGSAIRLPVGELERWLWTDLDESEGDDAA